MKKNSLCILSIIFVLALVLSCFTIGASANWWESNGVDWISTGVSDPTDYEYSFAIVGDTQKLVAHYANQLVLDRGDAEEIKYKYNYKGRTAIVQ